MKIAAVTMVKNEADILPWILRHTASWADRIYILDSSDDGTTEAVQGLVREGLPIVLVQDEEPGYFQDAKITALCERAHRELNPSWIIPFDADEAWFIDLPQLAAVPADVQALGTRWTNYRVTSKDGDSPNPTQRMQWREVSHEEPYKLMVRWIPGMRLGIGSHSVFMGESEIPYQLPDWLKCCHFQYRAAAQLLRKVTEGQAAVEARTEGGGEEHPITRHWTADAAVCKAEGLAGAERLLAAKSAVELVHEPVRLREVSNPWLSLIVPTIGKPSLVRCLRSIASQHNAGVETILVCDGPAPSAVSLWQQFDLPGKLVQLDQRHQDWGAYAREQCIAHASGEWIAYLDDDDACEPNSFATIAAALHGSPSLPHIFRMRWMHSGETVPRDDSLRVGNIGTPCIVFPRTGPRGRWMRMIGQDYVFVSETVAAYGNATWHPDIIAHVWPPAGHRLVSLGDLTMPACRHKSP